MRTPGGTCWRISVAPKGDGKPQVEVKSVVSHIGQQDEAVANDTKISPHATEMLAHYIILPQQPLNNHRCEGICTQHEKGEAGQDVGNAVFVCGLVEKINDIKVGEDDKIVKEHIQKRSFTLPGAVLKAWAEAKNKDSKGDVILLCHGAVVAAGINKFGAPLWFAAVADSCHNGAGGKYLRARP